MTNKCEICGAQVRIEGTTTQYYVPIADERVKELERKLEFVREALCWEKHRCGNLHGPLREALEEILK